jgi:hypothetical protein
MLQRIFVIIGLLATTQRSLVEFDWRDDRGDKTQFESKSESIPGPRTTKVEPTAAVKVYTHNLL